MPQQILAGECTEIAWGVEGPAELIKLSRNGEVLLEDSRLSATCQDCPIQTGTFTYRIDASNAAGDFAWYEQALIVNQAPGGGAPTPTSEDPGTGTPVIVSFSASPGQIQVGQCV